MDQTISLFQNLSNRLRYIECCLSHKRFVTRADLIEKFNLSEASATRAIKEYIDLSDQKNAQFNKETKANEITHAFKPLFTISEEEALYWLQLESVPELNQLLVYGLPKINLPEQAALAPIIHGIIHKKCVKITYLSLKSGMSKERIVAPHALFNDGLRLYIRLFDRNYSKFIDMSPARIMNAECLNESVQPHESPTNDIFWNEEIELLLMPHPKLNPNQAAVIEYEYQMVRGKRKISVKKSTANYFLRVWNVDCSESGMLNPQSYHLWLENRHDILSHLNPMAPGFQSIPSTNPTP